MNRRRIGVILIGAGVVIAALVGFVVYQTSVEAETLRAAQPKTWAVVAKIAIPARTVILDEQVDIIKVQDEAIPTTAAVARPPRPGDDATEADKQRAKAQIIGQV